MARLDLKAVITADDQASAKIRNVGNNTGDTFAAMGRAATRFAAIAIASFTTVAGAGVKTAGDLESARSAFEALLGSAEKADATMARIKKEAKETPFELTGLTQATKQLVSVTRDGDKAIDILMSVGKAITASGGGQEELNRVVFNLKQIQGMGKLTAIDLREIQRAVPIFDQLAEAAGTSAEELKNADDPAKELFRVFEEGGKKMSAVDRAFSIQAGNFNQLVSNMKDSFAIFTSELVKKLGIFDAVKGAVGFLTQSLTGLDDKILDVVNRVKEWINTNIWAQTFLIAFEDLLKSIWGNIKRLWEIIQENKVAIQAWAGLIGGILVVAIYAILTALNAFIWYAGKVVEAFGWLYNKGMELKNFLTGLFAGAFDYVANRWQSGISRLMGFLRTLRHIYNTISGGLGRVGINIGTIPAFASGGVMQNDGLAYLHKGEMVVPRDQVTNNSMNVNFYGNINNTSNASLDEIGQRIGRQIQLASQGV